MTRAVNPAAGARTWVLWAVLPLLILILYAPVLPELVQTWEHDPDNAHGFLVPVLSAWLIWRKRARLAGAPIRTSWWGLLEMAAAFTAYFLGHVGHMAVLARISLVFLLHGTVLLTLGREFERRVRYPILFLLFMVPVPDSVRGLVAFPLQLFASRISAFLLNTLGVVTVREGNVLHLPNTSLEVAAACSGIRSMVSYLMLGVFFSYVNRNRVGVTALLIGLSIPIALAANIARVVLSGMLATWYGPETAEGFLHEASGLVLFAVGFLVFLGLNAFLNRYWPGRKEPAPTLAAARAREVGAPELRALAAAVLFFVAGILAVQSVSHQVRVEIVERRLTDLPLAMGDWRGFAARFAEEERINRILGVDISFFRVYERGDDRVFLYSGYYGTEKGGRSSHNPEACYLGAGWAILERGSVVLAPEGWDRGVSVNRLVVGSGEQREEMLHWYQVAGTEVVRGGIRLNLLRFWRSIVENRNDGAFVRVTAPVDPEQPERALAVVREFSEELIPLFASYWPVEREVSSKATTAGGQANRNGR